jgi:hypothetical protein
MPSPQRRPAKSRARPLIEIFIEENDDSPGTNCKIELVCAKIRIGQLSQDDRLRILGEVDRALQEIW